MIAGSLIISLIVLHFDFSPPRKQLHRGSKRDKLVKVRVDIAKLRKEEYALEQELLDEQPDDLPHRKAAGIPRGD